ncbi:HET-domain-containing protein, partial [Lophiostoma macrostomum CBS 122681]
YVALSYCWGGDQKHKTTRQHMPTRTIASSELPKTIQDAVHVAWELGQKYLWVDSMCLIQDDEEDKAREMAQMPQIYNSAVVTILAASAERASDGFLHPRPEPQVFQFSMQVGNEKAEVYGLEADDFGFPTPLDRRGWCLQERVLSNRILVFDRRHIRFKCTCARAPGRVHTDGWTSQAEGRSDFDSLIISKKESLRDIWNPIVEDYSQRQFTIASDRVVAISGVAARLASQVNDMYLAGHWSSSLPHDLLWQRKWDGATCRLFDGPTWSWTVAAGTVKLFKESTDTHSQERIAVFCDAKIELQHEAAPYGAVKQAILTVK